MYTMLACNARPYIWPFKVGPTENSPRKYIQNITKTRKQGSAKKQTKEKTAQNTKHKRKKKVQTWCNKITLKPIITRISIIGYFKCKILICKKKQKTKTKVPKIIRSKYYD